MISSQAENVRQNRSIRRRDQLSAGWLARVSRSEVWLVLLLLVCYSYFFPRWADWGVNSKMDLTMAIVDRGTIVIDDYRHNTGDYALYKGHYYSDKAPGSSFLAVPVYAAFKAITSTSVVDLLIDRLARSQAMMNTLREDGTGLLRDKVYFAMALYAVTFFLVSLPSALLGLILYRFLADFVQGRFSRVLIVVLYGLGTVAFPYAQTLSGRQISAAMTIALFYLLFRLKRYQLSARFLWLVGLLMGFVVITDYPSVLTLGALVLYALGSPCNWRRALPIIVGAVPPVALMCFYNLSAFETLLPVGYRYSVLYQDLHSQGVISITYPKLEALYGLTFSPFRGLFFLSPGLLLAFPGYVYWYRMNTYRAEWWVGLWSVLSALLFYSSSAMWWGGYAVGPAYLAAVMPYLVFPIAFFLQRHRRSSGIWVVVGVLTALSIALVWTETIAGQAFPDLTPNPLIAISLPALIAGDVARNLGMVLGLGGWLSLLPLLLVIVPVLLNVFRSGCAVGSESGRYASEII